MELLQICMEGMPIVRKTDKHVSCKDLKGHLVDMP